MWEYIRTDIKYKTIIDLNQQLKELGDDNWEIISYKETENIKYDRTHIAKIFAKRPKEV